VVEAEEHRRLLVQHGLGRIDVLRLVLVVVEQPARTEADDLPAGHPDRPQQPAVEAVHRAALALPRQPGRLELLELKPLAQQVFRQRIPARGCEAAAEMRRGLRIEVAVQQVLTGGGCLVGLQRLGVELLRGCVGGDQAAATAAVALHAGRRTGVGDGEADAVGE
jgi:hypothetical protein